MNAKQNQHIAKASILYKDLWKNTRKHGKKIEKLKNFEEFFL